jgi:hypothetical protein
MALQKSEQDFEKYKQTQKQPEKAQSLKEIEEDIKKLSKEVSTCDLKLSIF